MIYINAPCHLIISITLNVKYILKYILDIHYIEGKVPDVIFSLFKVIQYLVSNEGRFYHDK